MSETAIITLIGILWGVVQMCIAGILGWIALELRLIRQGLESKVEKDDCKDSMCSHYQEIQNLWKETRDQGERIAKLEP